MADYEFLLRDPLTLEYVDELHPDDLAAVKWTRRDIGGGKWSATLPRVTTRRNYGPSVLAPHRILEVRRDGEQEFVGVLESRQIDPLGRIWTIGGPDLAGFWLPMRTVGATTPEARSGAAETVAKAYIEAHIGPSAAVARRPPGPATWTVEADGGAGGAVTISAQRRSLLQVAQEAVLAGDLTHEVVLLPDFSGYQYQVRRPVDGTVGGSGAAPFSVDWNNVEELVYLEDFREYRNMLYVAGDGTGAARNVTEVEGADVGTHFRREGTLDARYATSAALRTAAGELDLAMRSQLLVRVSATPFRGSANAVYREDWDIGWNITFGESELREEPIDIRVVAATVELTRAVGERITFELGEYQPTSTLRRLGDALRRLQVAANE